MWPYASNPTRERKPFNKDAVMAPNVQSYNKNYDKFQVRQPPMGVPEYKMNEGNKWQQSYDKIQTSSHQEFKPVYGPQGDNR